MLKPYDPALMEAYAVNRAVNSVKNDTEECIEPVADFPHLRLAHSGDGILRVAEARTLGFSFIQNGRWIIR
jgi:hypothetical protein